MGKWQNDLMLDAALDYLKNNAVLLTVCSTQPTTYAEASATYKLADVTIDSADFTHSGGVINGRRTTIAQQADILIDATGDAQHIALCSGAALLYVVTCATQSLTSGNYVTVPAWDVELRDAA
jgi:hypothetical protein